MPKIKTTGRWRLLWRRRIIMVPQFFVGVINTIECPVISTSMQNQGIGYLEKPHYIYFKLEIIILYTDGDCKMSLTLKA